MSLIASAAILAVIFWAVKADGGERVVIKQNNETVYEAPLSEDNRIELEGNRIVIESGSVYMQWADCKNQLCVNEKSISEKGQSIICLPNKVIAEIK